MPFWDVEPPFNLDENIHLLSPSGNGRKTLAFRRRLQFDLPQTGAEGSRVLGVKGNGHEVPFHLNPGPLDP